jgi:hypothetical protein
MRDLREKWPVNLACDSDFHVNRRDLLHAANLLHGTDGFTSPPKEGMLWIFSPEQSDSFGRIRTHDIGYQRPETGQEMAGRFGLRFRLPRKSQGSFTYRKSATWDRRLYFPSEGKHAVDFFRPKNSKASAGFEPAIQRPEASMLTTRPP